MKKPKIKLGRKPDLTKDKKVLFLRKRNKLSFRQISQLMGEDVKNIYVRYKRALVNYPQGRS